MLTAHSRRAWKPLSLCWMMSARLCILSIGLRGPTVNGVRWRRSFEMPHSRLSSDVRGYPVYDMETQRMIIVVGKLLRILSDVRIRIRSRINCIAPLTSIAATYSSIVNSFVPTRSCNQESQIAIHQSDPQQVGTRTRYQTRLRLIDQRPRFTVEWGPLCPSCDACTTATAGLTKTLGKMGMEVFRNHDAGAERIGEKQSHLRPPALFLFAVTSRLQGTR